ncbi:hypothetical protein M9458_046358, partial [Cirrhinus mrigala]
TLPLPGGADKCAPVGILQDEAMLSIYNVLRALDTHMSDADPCCLGDAQNSSLPLKMKWADLMCRPAWK